MDTYYNHFISYGPCCNNNTYCTKDCKYNWNYSWYIVYELLLNNYYNCYYDGAHCTTRSKRKIKSNYMQNGWYCNRKSNSYTDSTKNIIINNIGGNVSVIGSSSLQTSTISNVVGTVFIAGYSLGILAFMYIMLQRSVKY